MSIISEIVRVISRKPPASLDSNTLHDLEAYLIKGDLETGIQEIEKYQQSVPEDNSFAKSYLEILKCRYIAENQNFDNSNEKLDHLTSEDMTHPVIAAYIPIERANILRLKGDFTAALELLDESDNLLAPTSFIYSPHYKRLKARLNNVKGKILNRTGKFDVAVDLMLESVKLFEDLQSGPLRAEPFSDLAIAFANKGDSEKGLQYFIDALEIYQAVGNDRQSLKLNNNIGLFNYNLGNIDEALTYYNKALELSKRLTIVQYTGPILLNIGLIYQDRGELGKSMENLEEALSIFEQMDNQHYIANAKYNLGNNYQAMGELDKAIKLYKESQVIWQQLDSKNDLAILYNSMAATYRDKGLNPRALDLVKKASEMSEEIGNYNFLIHPLSLYIEILMDMDKVDEAETVLEKFESILPKVDSRLGEQFYKLSHALILLKSARVVKKAEAQTILTELAEDEEIAVQYAIKAYLKLADLLLQELNISASEEALNEFKGIISKLTKLTESESGANLTPTSVNILILRSKLAIIDLDIEEAQRLQKEAYDIAKKNGLKQLAQVVKEEQEIVKNQMLKYKQMVDTNATLYERLQESQIENYLKRAENILKK